MLPAKLMDLERFHVHCSYIGGVMMKLFTRHPVASATTGAALVVGSMATYELFPERENTRGEDTAFYAGMALAIGGGAASLFRANRVRGRMFGGLVGAAASLLATVTVLAFFFGEKGEQQ
jgi:hypothetical protein